MESSDLEQTASGVKDSDDALYENTRISYRRVAHAAHPHEEDSDTSEGHYEELRLSLIQNKEKRKNASTNIKWEDLPNRIKCTVYTFLTMLVVLYIVVLVAIVISALAIGGETWTHWSPWSHCDVTCDNGTQTRMRFCTNPFLSSGGPDSSGRHADTKLCQKDACPGGETWTHWSPWSNCDVTCDNGTQTRMRFCTNPFLSSGGPDCSGRHTDTKLCQKDACPVQGGETWTHWSPWSNCDVTCDNGTQTRMRFCTNPFLSSGGPDCSGRHTDTKLCQKDACPGGETWTHWSPWSNCDVTCDNGTQTRMRFCTNPFLSGGGPDCSGRHTDTKLCQKDACPEQNVSNQNDASAFKNSNYHRVAFTAYGSSSEKTETVIKFPKTLLNIGEGYNTSTGTFTCTIPGIYHFGVTLTKKSQYINLVINNLKVNGSIKLWLRQNQDKDYGIDYGSYSLSAAGNFHLNKNDYVVVTSVPSYFFNDRSTSFTGVLIIPDA